MSDSLFSFPGTDAGQDAGSIFEGEGASLDSGGVLGGIDFTELGSADDQDNPFADMMSPAGATALTGGAPAAESAASVNNVPPAQQAPSQPETPQAPPPAPPAEMPKTPPAKADEDAPNPLMAAIDLQEKKNAAQAAAPVFAQLPVFSYNGNQEPIEKTEQTFEELRQAKVDDFPEFEEAQSVSWSVTYGKITKNVATPRKTRIGDLKREIESSKEFMDALKKAADKRPKCIVKPTVRMQKKGECSYKGVFPTLTDARASSKTICFIPARDGRVYDRRVTDAGEFITPASNVTCLDEIRAGFLPALPLIPHALIAQAVALFRSLMDHGESSRSLEALVHIYWDRTERQFFLHVPTQRVGKASVDAVLDEEWLCDERYFHYADLHSHNNMPAQFSEIDDRDERANRVYMVMGRLDRYYPEITVRVCNGGHFCEIAPEQVLEPMPEADFPLEWLSQIKPAESRDFLPFEVAA